MLVPMITKFDVSKSIALVTWNYHIYCQNDMVHTHMETQNFFSHKIINIIFEIVHNNSLS
jgi:hypothetical protein